MLNAYALNTGAYGTARLRFRLAGFQNGIEGQGEGSEAPRLRVGAKRRPEQGDAGGIKGGERSSPTEGRSEAETRTRRRRGPGGGERSSPTEGRSEAETRTRRRRGPGGG